MQNLYSVRDFFEDFFLNLTKYILEKKRRIYSINYLDLHLTKMIFLFPDNHTEIVKLLVLAGADLKFKNKDGRIALDYAAYNSETREVLKDAATGDLPEIEDYSEVCLLIQDIN